MAAQMTAKQNMMDHSDMNHGEMNHSEHMAMMQMMTMDNQDCCGDNCACPQAAFSGIALVESLDEDFNPNLSQRIRLALFSVKEDQPTNPSPPPITT